MISFCTSMDRNRKQICMVQIPGQLMAYRRSLFYWEGISIVHVLSFPDSNYDSLETKAGSFPLPKGRMTGAIQKKTR